MGEFHGASMELELNAHEYSETGLDAEPSNKDCFWKTLDLGALVWSQQLI